MGFLSLGVESAIRYIKISLFSASIVPSCIAGALCYSRGEFILSDFLLLTLALFLGQAAGDYLYFFFTNFHSEPKDAHTKIFSGWKPLFSDKLIKGKNHIYAAVFCLIIDSFIAFYFMLRAGHIIILFAGIGVLVAIFFTAFMKKGYKEPVIFFTFGPLSVMGAYTALTHSLSFLSGIISLPIAFFVTLVAHLKGAHYGIQEDGFSTRITNIKPGYILFLLIAGYGSLCLFVILGIIPVIALLGFVSLPFSIRIIKTVQTKESNLQPYLWAVVQSIIVFIINGCMISLAFVNKGV